MAGGDTWTTAEAARAWDVTESRARYLAPHVPGATRADDRWGSWRIPVGAEKPPDPTATGKPSGGPPKLSDELQREAYERWQGGEGLRALGREYGVSASVLTKYFRRISES